MDITIVWILLAVVIGAFIVFGLVAAFVADRRRNQEVEQDPERVEPDPGPGHQSGTHPGPHPGPGSGPRPGEQRP